MISDEHYQLCKYTGCVNLMIDLLHESFQNVMYQMQTILTLKLLSSLKSLEELINKMLLSAVSTERSAIPCFLCLEWALCEPWHLSSKTQISTIIAQAPPVQIFFHINSTTLVGSCWRLSRGDCVIVHRVLKFIFLFCFVYFFFLCRFPFFLIVFKGIVKCRSYQMMSCPFLLWTAHNVVFYLFSFNLTLI